MGEYGIYPMGSKNGYRAAGYNSAESKPIWMKSRMVWAKCFGFLKHNFENFTIKGRFSKKTHKLLNNVLGLAISSRYNFATITKADYTSDPFTKRWHELDYILIVSITQQHWVTWSVSPVIQ